MKTLLLVFALSVLPLLGCSKVGSVNSSSPSSLSEGGLGTDLPETPVDSETPSSPESPIEDPISETPSQPDPVSPSFPIEDSKIKLDSYGESYQAQIASRLIASRYMEKNCNTVWDWDDWEGLPLVHCRYRTGGQNAEVLMLNPGPRRLTLWLEEACGSFAKDFQSCMDKAFKQILYQAGGQFPVSGIVIEDMDGNGRGNAYAFRNGVTVQISAFGTGTESTISEAQIDRSFTDAPIKTYTYGRPISLTREQLTSYAKYAKLGIPNLGSSSARTNTFNEVMRDLYKSAWSSSQNHIIRAWVFNQGY